LLGADGRRVGLLLLLLLERILAAAAAEEGVGVGRLLAADEPLTERRVAGAVRGRLAAEPVAGRLLRTVRSRRAGCWRAAIEVREKIERVRSGGERTSGGGVDGDGVAAALLLGWLGGVPAGRS